jgi:hypothetical protein
VTLDNASADTSTDSPVNRLAAIASSTFPVAAVVAVSGRATSDRALFIASTSSSGMKGLGR